MGDDFFVVVDDLAQAAHRFERTSEEVERAVDASAESAPGALGYGQVESAYAAFRAHWGLVEHDTAATAAQVAPRLQVTAATYRQVDAQTADRFDALRPPF